MVEMQAVCLRMMLPTAPASPGVGVREDDGHGVSSEARSFYPLLACVFTVFAMFAFCICWFRGFINLKLGLGLMF